MSFVLFFQSQAKLAPQAVSSSHFISFQYRKLDEDERARRESHRQAAVTCIRSCRDISEQNTSIYAREPHDTLASLSVYMYTYGNCSSAIRSRPPLLVSSAPRLASLAVFGVWPCDTRVTPARTATAVVPPAALCTRMVSMPPLPRAQRNMFVLIDANRPTARRHRDGADRTARVNARVRIWHFRVPSR